MVPFYWFAAKELLLWTIQRLKESWTGQIETMESSSDTKFFVRVESIGSKRVNQSSSLYLDVNQRLEQSTSLLGRLKPLLCMCPGQLMWMPMLWLNRGLDGLTETSDM